MLKRSTGPAGGNGTLSLIVPTWNEEASLPRLLGATLGAPDPRDRPDEVVIADGGSSDRTRELAGEWGCVVISSEQGRGLQLARGAQATRGDLLAFLHADSLPFPGSLAAIREAFRDPEVEVCSFAQSVEAEGRFYRWVEAIADRRARRGWVYGDSGLVLRRSLYSAVGGYGPHRIFEDLELSKLLRERAEVHLPREARIGVCARRWKREGATWTVVRNWILTQLWRVGVDPRHLARFYPSEPQELTPPRSAAEPLGSEPSGGQSPPESRVGSP